MSHDTVRRSMSLVFECRLSGMTVRDEKDNEADVVNLMLRRAPVPCSLQQHASKTLDLPCMKL